VPVRRALSKAGFKNVYIVPEQELPDGNFPTVSYPNPEDAKTFVMALALADKHAADIVVATDPDADRVGIAVKNNGEYKLLTGNMTGVILAEYILSSLKEKGKLPANGALISTIVSTDMTKAIAKAYNMAYFDVLTGFKYIGEKIKEFEQTGQNSYVFGFEESYGCLAGTYARDKDAVVASLLICEAAAYYKKQGMTLLDALDKLYAKYGYFTETIESITLKGLEGLADMRRIMAGLRANPPINLAGANVTEARDYLNKVIVYPVEGRSEATALPVSDVLYYTLDDGCWVCVRPSGTEPKIKIYFGALSANRLSELKEAMKEVIN
jgi:phosphoglucomutase